MNDWKEVKRVPVDAGLPALQGLIRLEPTDLMPTREAAVEVRRQKDGLIAGVRIRFIPWENPE
jgi:hypothetical protein